MIRKMLVTDFDSIYKLGKKVNLNYVKLYDLEEIINDESQKIYVYTVNNTVVGFIHILVSVEEADIIDIVILNEYRRQNIGTKLINFAIAKNNLTKLNLEVRESNNGAIAFYQHLNFKKIRKIKDYYKGENAIFMIKEVTNIWKMCIY